MLACGGGTADTGTPAEDDTGSLDTGTADTGSVPTYADVEAEVLGACMGCHYGQPAGLGFVDAYDSLVNVPSTQAPGMVRVAPGDPDNSYLWRKLEGTHTGVGSGDRMPQGGTLSADGRALVLAWIEGGALR
jgi:hypothetical protein